MSLILVQGIGLEAMYTAGIRKLPAFPITEKSGRSTGYGHTQENALAMPDVIIENPVINSPFEEPRRHFRFTEDGITDEVVQGRRISEYFVPIPRSKKKSPKQMSFETEWTSDRLEENKTINRIRERVGLWRKGGYKGITPVTARLLEYWQRPGRERRLFFAQIEALETAIYLAEVAGKVGDAWIENYIRDENARANPLLYRIAFKIDRKSVV